MDWRELTAFIVAVAGAVKVLLTYLEKRDVLILRFRSMESRPYPNTSLFVVNRSKHNVLVIDYGFIFSDGRLYSLPNELDDALFNDYHFQMLGELKPGEHQEASADFVVSCIGCFAKTSVQRVPRLAFRSHVPLKLKLFLRWNAIWGGMRGLRKALSLIEDNEKAEQINIPPPLV